MQQDSHPFDEAFSKAVDLGNQIADNDDKSNPTSKDILRKAFDDAKVPAEIEVYAGAQHGWCPPDMKVYDEEKAEKAWSRLLVLFSGALPAKS